MNRIPLSCRNVNGESPSLKHARCDWVNTAQLFRVLAHRPVHHRAHAEQGIDGNLRLCTRLLFRPHRVTGLVLLYRTSVHTSVIEALGRVVASNHQRAETYLKGQWRRRLPNGAIELCSRPLVHPHPLPLYVGGEQHLIAGAYYGHAAVRPPIIPLHVTPQDGKSLCGRRFEQADIGSTPGVLVIPGQLNSVGTNNLKSGIAGRDGTRFSLNLLLRRLPRFQIGPIRVGP